MAVNVDVMLFKAYDYTDAKTGEAFTLPYRVYYPTDYETNPEKTYRRCGFYGGDIWLILIKK